MHHRHKVDAPSGTALKLGEAAAAGAGVALARSCGLCARRRHRRTQAGNDRFRDAARRRRRRRAHGRLRRRGRAARAHAPRDVARRISRAARCARRASWPRAAREQRERPLRHGRRARHALIRVLQSCRQRHESAKIGASSGEGPTFPVSTSVCFARAMRASPSPPPSTGLH